jgi:hypothetical protein
LHGCQRSIYRIIQKPVRRNIGIQPVLLIDDTIESDLTFGFFDFDVGTRLILG